jgi:hypothetical protein
MGKRIGRRGTQSARHDGGRREGRAKHTVSWVSDCVHAQEQDDCQKDVKMPSFMAGGRRMRRKAVFLLGGRRKPSPSGRGRAFEPCRDPAARLLGSHDDEGGEAPQARSQQGVSGRSRTPFLGPHRNQDRWTPRPCSRVPARRGRRALWRAVRYVPSAARRSRRTAPGAGTVRNRRPPAPASAGETRRDPVGFRPGVGGDPSRPPRPRERGSQPAIPPRRRVRRRPDAPRGPAGLTAILSPGGLGPGGSP